MTHSPLPWSLEEQADGDHVIRDANGKTVHMDTQYYPSGMAVDDARLIVRAVNALWPSEVKRAALDDRPRPYEPVSKIKS